MKTVKIAFALLGLILAGCAGKNQKERVPLDYSLPASEYKTRLQASDPETWKPVATKATIPTGGVALAGNGLFKPAMELNVSYLLNSFSVNHLLHPFRIRAGKDFEPDSVPQVGFWDTELRGSSAGRFLMGAGNTLRWEEYPELRKRLDELIDGIEACREPGGYILPYHPDSARSEEPNYARAWLTHGLIEAAIAGNPKAYGLLRGHADWFNRWDKMLPKLLYWNYNNHQGHIASTRTYLSPVGKPEDLQVAEKYYVCDWWMDELAAGQDSAVWQYPLQNPHSYLITSFEAYLDHYLATGDKTYLDAMLGAWQLIHDKWEHVGGSISICESKWIDDGHGHRIKDAHQHPPCAYSLTSQGHTGETCGSVFWIKLNQRLHQLFPEEEKYVAEIEKSLYNVILANQTEKGNIRYHARMQGKKENPRSAANTCCEGQGTRLLGSLPEYIYSIATDGLYVNLYEPSSIRWTVKEQPVSLTLESDFPFRPQVGLKIAVSSPVKMNLRVRIPSWATQKVEISVNGKKYATGKPGKYVELSRKWEDGDRVGFTLPFDYRITQYAGVDTVAGYERYAVEYGPILLASVGGDKAPHELRLIRHCEERSNPERSVGGDKAPHELGASNLEKQLIPDQSRPLHFSVAGDTLSFMPYWMIPSGQVFSVFPLIKVNSKDLKQPVLFGGKPLPESYSSPDGCTVGPDGSLYISINQVASGWKYPGKIARISPDGTLEDFFTLPVNSKTGKASPLGLVFATDGNLYVSDNQSFCTNEPNQAGVIRVVIENGKPQRGELVVSGLNASNGITRWKNYLYVAETNLGTPDKYMSGVYRFSLDELAGDDTLIVTGIGDPHLILSFETKNKEQAVGANGIGVDSQGNLYVNNFGDVEVLKYTFDDKGKVSSSEVFCRPEGALSLDGMQIDRDDNLWIADFAGNAILVIDTKTRVSRIIAKSEPLATGVNGELDTPSECIRWGDKVYVSNIDLDSGEQAADAIQTISVISLK